MHCWSEETAPSRSAREQKLLVTKISSAKLLLACLSVCRLAPEVS